MLSEDKEVCFGEFEGFRLCVGVHVLNHVFLGVCVAMCVYMRACRRVKRHRGGREGRSGCLFLTAL